MRALWCKIWQALWATRSIWTFWRAPQVPALPAVSLVLHPAARRSLSSTHVGSLVQGQSIGVYTLAVVNSGTAATSGTVTVMDILPAGLTATAINGPGWTCTLTSLTCSRTDSLAAGAKLPARGPYNQRGVQRRFTSDESGHRFRRRLQRRSRLVILLTSSPRSPISTL